MNTIISIQQEIEATRRLIKPLSDKLTHLTIKLRDEKSREFIRVNRITSADCEDRDGPNKPYFNICAHFALWLKDTGCTKRFAVWNGILHYTSDLMAGKFEQTDGLYEHVPQPPNPDESYRNPCRPDA